MIQSIARISRGCRGFNCTGIFIVSEGVVRRFANGTDFVNVRIECGEMIRYSSRLE